MEKISKLLNVQASGTFKEMYKFELEFENGDTGILYRKTNEAKVTVGDSYNYSLNDKGTVKIVNPKYANGGATPFKNGGGGNNKDPEEIARMNSLTNATNFWLNEESKTEDKVLATAQVFRDWVRQDCCEVKKPEVPELEVITTDDTPF